MAHIVIAVSTFKKIFLPETLSIFSNARNSALTFLFSASISFIASVMVTNALGPEGRGALTWLLTLYTLGINISLFGLHNVNSQLAAENRKYPPVLIRISALALCVAYIIVCPAIYWIYHSNEVAELHKGVFILMVLLLPLGALNVNTLAIVLGLRFNRLHNVMILLEKGLYGLLCLGIVVLGHASIESVCGVFALTTSLSLMTALYVLRKDFVLAPSHKNKSLKSVWAKSRGLVGYSGYSYFSSILVLASELFIIALCVKHVGVAGLGIYGAARIITDGFSVSFGYFNVYARSQLSSEKSLERRVLIHKNICIFLSLAFVLLGGMLFFSAPLITDFLFGAKFSGAAEILQILAIHLVLVSCNGCSVTLVNSVFKNYIITINPTIYALSVSIYAYQFIPIHGASGAAMALACGSATTLFSSCCVYFYTVKKIRLGQI